MDPKYKNIFWHQGVKVFEKQVLEGKTGQIKVAHLENDVTKALLNLFDHCSPAVLKSFLQILHIKQAPGAFNFDFQVSDTNAYRRHPKRIMLAIISADTQEKSGKSYSVTKTIPDACIFSNDTAILIESKTQSPLIEEQIKSQINQFFGTATKERRITWEDISEKFRILSGKLKGLDAFLVEQFCDFLELIGISKFNGFSELDFYMLGSLGKIPDEDYADSKRLFHRKISKFMEMLKIEMQSVLNFKNFDIHISRVPTQAIETHSGFYFYDKNPKIHVNHYPSINIIYFEYSMQLTLNAEIQHSVKCIKSCLENKGDKVDAAVKKQSGLKLFVDYKLQYMPMSNFIWDLIPGFPKDAGTFQAKEILEEIEAFKKQWGNFKKTVLYQMESGRIKHPSGQLFNETELSYARTKNPKPNYAFRFGWQYPVDQISKKKKKIVQFFKQEIVKLKPLAELIMS
ncbi:hypothetical protein LCGC14_2108710 [marine sediment metagenome]|uniref:Uncharacterized protein n=1 Tax=marine sediment metagenome TaxID=412755 RepID=A0A0F9E7N0_9ZZZZ